MLDQRIKKPSRTASRALRFAALVIPLLAAASLALSAGPATTSTAISLHDELIAEPRIAPLGSNTKVRFSFINTGNSPVQLWDIGGFGDAPDPRFKLRATAADGSPIPSADSGFRSFDRMVSLVSLAPGERWSIVLDLAAYCWIDRPGTYTISCEQEASSDLDIPADSLPPAKCTVTFTGPTPQQAQEIFDAALKEPDPVLSLRPMHEAIYLPLLLKLGKTNHEQARLALAESFTPAATRAMIQLAGDSDDEACAEALSAISDRMNGAPPGILGGEVPAWIYAHRAANEYPWQPAMAATLRPIAIKRLSSSNANVKASAGVVMEYIGEAEDGPAVVAAMDSTLTEECAGPLTRQPFLPSIVASDCQRVVEQGYKPPNPPTNFGETVAYLQALLSNAQFRPDGWEARCIAWTSSPSPTIRRMALSAQPDPLSPLMASRLPTLLADKDASMVQAVCVRLQKQKVNDTLAPLMKLMVILRYQPAFDAFKAAVVQGGRVRALNAAVDQIESNVGLEMLCSDVLDGGDRSFVNRSEKIQDVATLRDRWHDWIDRHRKELEAGTKFNRNDSDFAGKLFPSQVQFHFKDGTLWPIYVESTPTTSAPE